MAMEATPDAARVRQISTCTINPTPPLVPARCELTTWDLMLLPVHYIQKGLLFRISEGSDRVFDGIINDLKSSLSTVLWHFYPLAGSLETYKCPEEATGLFTYIDCTKGGAEFTTAVAENISVSDVTEPSYVPTFVRDFFTPNDTVSHDGHEIPLLAVQVTTLTDGIFIGCSFNHSIGDGSSFWHFFKSWAEIHRNCGPISRPPIHERWFVDGTTVPIRLPFNGPGEFIKRWRPPQQLRERVFHFSADSIAKLKARANHECEGKINISSFQALSALIWKSIIRAKAIPEHKQTSLFFSIDTRSRLRPALSPNYFGNCINSVIATSNVGDLLANNLGWSAKLLNETIALNTSERQVREAVERWMESPKMVRLGDLVNECLVQFGSSPRFDVYGCDFGWGKAVAVRSGGDNKFDGKVMSFPGRMGDGSVDYEISLSPEYMRAMELDEEFMGTVTPNYC